MAAADVSLTMDLHVNQKCLVCRVSQVYTRKYYHSRIIAARRPRTAYAYEWGKSTREDNGPGIHPMWIIPVGFSYSISIFCRCRSSSPLFFPSMFCVDNIALHLSRAHSSHTQTVTHAHAAQSKAIPRLGAEYLFREYLRFIFLLGWNRASGGCATFFFYRQLRKWLCPWQYNI